MWARSIKARVIKGSCRQQTGPGNPNEMHAEDHRRRRKDKGMGKIHNKNDT